jgi:hypothetical protein
LFLHKNSLKLRIPAAQQPDIFCAMASSAHLVIKNLVQIREQCTVQDNSFGTEGRGTGFAINA